MKTRTGIASLSEKDIEDDAAMGTNREQEKAIIDEIDRCLSMLDAQTALEGVHAERWEKTLLGSQHGVQIQGLYLPESVTVS